MVRKFIIFILVLFGCVLFNQPGVFAAQASPVVLREPRLVLKPVFLTDFRNEVVESPVDSKLSLRNPAIGSARRKMDEGVLAVRRIHFSSATQETWGYPPPQSRASRDEKCGLDSRR